MMERAFQGFQQLEGPKPETAWSILGVDPQSSAEVCRQARNHLAKLYHPDNGSQPNADMMAKVNSAFTQAIA